MAENAVQVPEGNPDILNEPLLEKTPAAADADPEKKEDTHVQEKDPGDGGGDGGVAGKSGNEDNEKLDKNWGVHIPDGEEDIFLSPDGRSEERRVGKECRSRWSPSH